MEFNNRTILILGLIILSFVAMYFSYKDIALAIASGLVGYLSKDVVPVDPVVSPVDPVDKPIDYTINSTIIQDDSNVDEYSDEDIA